MFSCYHVSELLGNDHFMNESTFSPVFFIFFPKYFLAYKSEKSTFFLVLINFNDRYMLIKERNVNKSEKINFSNII